MASAWRGTWRGGRDLAWRATRAPVRRLDHTAEQLWELSLQVRRLPGRGEMTALLRRNGLGTFAEYVHGQMHRPAGNFLPTDRERWCQQVQGEWPEAATETLATAEALLAGKLSLFGHRDVPMRRAGPVTTGPALTDWRRDPLSGSRFARGFSEWRWDAVRMRPAGADVKGPWEVTRAQHLVTLGQAYWLSGDERMARHFAATVADFIRSNPVRLGVHWACNMDVSLRVVGWLSALSFFQGSPALNRAWWELFCRSLVAHGRFIMGHLEFGTLDGRIVTSNHYLANVFGLHWLALNFPGLDAGAVWRGCAERGLESECQRQVLADGGPFESSVPYLRLVLEMLLSGWALSEQAGHPLSPEYRRRLTAGLEFVAELRQEGGHIPQVGDADNGRAHIFTEYAVWEPSSADWLLAAGAHVLGRPDLAQGIEGAASMEPLFWGPPGKAEEGAVGGIDLRHVRNFPSSRIAVIRDDKTHLTICNTGIGTEGFGNHKHNDQLSVEWGVGRQPIFADPGSYTYTQDPRARNAFRGTAFHTTVMVDRQEHHELRPDLLFRLFAQGDGTLEAGKAGVLGAHTAYQRLGVSHRRRISVAGEGCVIVDDFFSGSEGHTLEWFFGLYPDVTPRVQPPGAVLQGPEGAGQVASLDLSFGVRDSWYSPGYGQRVPTRQLYARRTDGPTRVTWALAPLSTRMVIEDAGQVADALWTGS